MPDARRGEKETLLSRNLDDTGELSKDEKMQRLAANSCLESSGELYTALLSLQPVGGGARLFIGTGVFRSSGSMSSNNVTESLA